MSATSDKENLKWKLDDLESDDDHGYDYDLIVIGGGSGGIALAKEASKCGAEVAVLDYVDPSPYGTTWGLGGTCVNVGCIPKKLMHTCAQYGDIIRDAHEYGWETVKDGKAKHNWESLVEIVQDYIGGLNFAYKKAFRDDPSSTYFNAKGTFVDAHTVHIYNQTGRKRDRVDKNISARRIVIAVGGRPRYPDLPGAKELCITSDDLFKLEKIPGKTLLIGASYVALECGGFLHGLGFDTTVMVRSILLRGYDQEVAEKIGSFMKETGVKFIRPATPTKFEKDQDSGKIRVHYTITDGSKVVSSHSELYDTVVLAIGRNLVTPQLNLEKAGVKSVRGGYIETIHDRTNVPHIYAIGDIQAGAPQLTPVAIQTGKLLAQRLYAFSSKLMDYNLVATTVFTPIEYGTIGLTEEAAEKKYPDDIEVYHRYFQPLEWNPLQDSDRPKNSCFMKLVTQKSKNEKVIGFHYLGLHAGEITQGYATAMRLGATKQDFDDTVGIHPTSAEQLHSITITKSSGEDAVADGACTT